MIHKNRAFHVATIESADELAEKFTNHTWTLCTGFRYRGYLFLNDSFSEDGASEFAVVRESDGLQVESVTFGWCSREEALSHIERAAAGAFDSAAFCKVELKAHSDYCHLCA
jgi:hypothetical protein